MKAKTSTPLLIKFLSERIFIRCLFLLFICFAPGRSLGGNLPAATFTDLKDFEGFYQFPNEVAYIQILQKDQSLVARQVWDNREYPLIRKADLSFESKDEEYSAQFVKDETGRIISINILNRVMLTKVDFDPNKEVNLTLDKLKRLEGTYQFQRDKNLFLEISTNDRAIELKQLWDGKIISFSAKSELHFFNKELSFPLTFVLTGNEIKEVRAFGSDLWDKVK
jgi:hypothetical protein